jgi:hypothetical protein
MNADRHLRSFIQVHTGIAGARLQAFYRARGADFVVNLKRNLQKIVSAQDWMFALHVE